MIKPIMTEEMKKEIVELLSPKNEGDGFSSREIGEIFDCGRDKVRKMIYELKKLGLIETIKITREGMDGRTYVSIGYRIKPAK